MKNPKGSMTGFLFGFIFVAIVTNILITMNTGVDLGVLHDVLSP